MMKSFKQFLILMEELNDRQKEIVDSWGKSGAAAKISGHVIPHGQDRITIPLEHPENQTPVSPHPDVEKHLNAHGYHVHDYKAGLALEPEKPGQSKRRPVKIGAALEKTGADKKVKDAFINDPRRRAAKKSGLQVVISRHPHDVAGMSTNQGWTSCMNMADGSNRHYLEQDVKHGTHVAYLTHEGDHEAKRPIARIALKPYNAVVSTDWDKHKGRWRDKYDSDDTILHPESFTYGTADSAFAHTVKRWTSQHFPLDPEKEYHRNGQVYKDDGNRVIIHHDKMFIHKKLDYRYAAFEQHADKVTPEHINRALGDENTNIRRKAISHPIATPENIDKALGDDDSYNRYQAIKHPNASPANIDRALDDKDEEVRAAAIRHPNATPANIDKALESQHPDIRESAIRHPNASPANIDKALEKKDWNIRAYAIRHTIATPENIDKALGDEHPGIREAAMRHPNATPANIDKALEEKDWRIRPTAIKHPNATPANIDKALGDEDSRVRGVAIQHPNATPSHIDRALGDVYKEVRASAIRHPNSTPENIDKALGDKDSWVREIAKSVQKSRR